MPQTLRWRIGRLGRGSVQQFAQSEHRVGHQYDELPKTVTTTVSQATTTPTPHGPAVADTHAGEHAADRRS